MRLDGSCCLLVCCLVVNSKRWNTTSIVVDRCSPLQEALDYSMKKDVVESSRSEKASDADLLLDDSDVSPLTSDDNSSEKSNSSRFVVYVYVCVCLCMHVYVCVYM